MMSVVIAILSVALSLGLIFCLPLIRQSSAMKNSGLDNALDDCEAIFTVDHDSIKN